MIRLLLPVLVVPLLALVAASSSQSSNCSPEEGTCQLYPLLEKPKEFTESSQGLQLAVRRWVPPEDIDVKAVLLFAHGGAGFHSGYSDIMGQSLSATGISVVSYDQAGSGYSEGPRNWFDSIDTVCEDYTHVLKKVKAENPGKQVFAMGESFGGLIILLQALQEQDKGDEGILADGYILAGPVINLLPEMLPPKPVLFIVNFLAKFFPMLNMPGTDFFSTFDLAFGDQSWAQTGRNDPIIQEAAAIAPKLGMISSVLSSLGRLQTSFEKVTVPLKILMGEKEGRVDTGAVKDLARDASSKDKDLEIVPGAYHQLFQDLPEVTQVVCQRVQEWVLARSS